MKRLKRLIEIAGVIAGFLRIPLLLAAGGLYGYYRYDQKAFDENVCIPVFKCRLRRLNASLKELNPEWDGETA